MPKMELDQCSITSVYNMILLLIVAFVPAIWCGRSHEGDYMNQILPGTRFSDNVTEDAFLDVPGLLRKYGYPVEEHTVTTEDGYILMMHRIPHGRNQSVAGVRRTVAFLMHGLTSSSADFVVLGPGDAIAYLLADAGYDVWLGNARGNCYSRRHIYLNPDSRFNTQFWRFSWDEIGNLDLPAFLDHIEHVTGQSRLHYIGHSQGSTTFFVLNALRPQYTEKFITFQGLAPGVFYKHIEQTGSIAPYLKIIEAASVVLFRGEILPHRMWAYWFTSKYCFDGSIFSLICTVVVNNVSDHINQTMIPVFLSHSPAGASIRQVIHHAQLIHKDYFRRYDHGPLQNWLAYGTVVPPDYDIERITTPCHIHYSMYDKLANWKDVEYLGSKLALAFLHKIEETKFTHQDFIWGSRARHCVYDRVISLMKQADRNS